MPAYVILMKLTDHGIQSIKNAPARIEATIRAFESIGGRVREFYSVTGEYDFICIVESPDDEVTMAFSLGLGADGDVKVKLQRAFTQGQFTHAIRKLDRLRMLASGAETPDDYLLLSE